MNQIKCGNIFFSNGKSMRMSDVIISVIDRKQPVIQIGNGDIFSTSQKLEEKRKCRSLCKFHTQLLVFYILTKLHFVSIFSAQFQISSQIL